MTKIISWGQYVLRSHLFQPPGNSLRYIDAAYGYGYDGVEIDVQLTREGALVLMHDNTLDRTTHGQGLVNQLSVEDLRKVALKDPWKGPHCYVESLSRALARNGTRGLVMVDMHHVVQKTATAVRQSVEEVGFDPAQLVLLTYASAGGRIYKELLPEAVVLLKGRHDLDLDSLTTTFLDDADGLDGVLLPIANDKLLCERYRRDTAERGLKLAVYTHDADGGALEDLFVIGVDYVTSIRPDVFGEPKNRRRVRALAEAATLA